MSPVLIVYKNTNSLAPVLAGIRDEAREREPGTRIYDIAISKDDQNLIFVWEEVSILRFFSDYLLTFLYSMHPRKPFKVSFTDPKTANIIQRTETVPSAEVCFREQLYEH